MKEVWIPGVNYIDSDDFTSLITSLVFVSIEKIYQTLETVFRRLSNTSNLVKNTRAPPRVEFSSVFGYPDETLSLVFDMLHQSNQPNECPTLHRSIRSKRKSNCASGAPFHASYIRHELCFLQVLSLDYQSLFLLASDYFSFVLKILS